MHGRFTAISFGCERAQLWRENIQHAMFVSGSSKADEASVFSHEATAEVARLARHSFILAFSCTLRHFIFVVIADNSQIDT